MNKGYFKIKILFVIGIFFIFYGIYYIINLFLILEQEERIKNKLEQKYSIVKKKKKVLKADYWSINNCIVNN
jgi:hypothetical protein